MLDRRFINASRLRQALLHGQGIDEHDLVALHRLGFHHAHEGVVADIGAVTQKRQIEEAERLFDTDGWKAYDKQLSGLAQAAQGAAANAAAAAAAAAATPAA